MNGRPSVPPQRPTPLGGKKVFDIVRPGKVIASPNSRSVVVTKPPVQDKQVVTAKHTVRLGAAPAAKRPLMSGRNRVQVAPSTSPAVSPVDGKPLDTGTAISTAPALTAAADLASKTVSPHARVKLEPATAPPVPATSSAPKTTHVHKVSVAEPDEPAASVVVHTDVSANPTDAPAAAASNETSPAVPAPKPISDVPDTPTSTVAPEPVAPAAQPTVPQDPLLDPAAAIDVSSLPDKPLAEQPSLPFASADADLSAGPKDASPQSGELIVRDSYRREDLLAGAGMVMPEDHQKRTIVSHHRRGLRAWQWVLIILLIIVIAAAAVNFLIDAEIIQTDLGLPTTNLL
jgi:hypothetical protein